MRWRTSATGSSWGGVAEGLPPTVGVGSDGGTAPKPPVLLPPACAQPPCIQLPCRAATRAINPAAAVCVQPARRPLRQRPQPVAAAAVDTRPPWVGVQQRQPKRPQQLQPPAAAACSAAEPALELVQLKAAAVEETAASDETHSSTDARSSSSGRCHSRASGEGLAKEQAAAWRALREARQRRVTAATSIQAFVRQALLLCFCHQPASTERRRIGFPSRSCVRRGMLARQELRWQRAAQCLRLSFLLRALQRWRAVAAARVLLRERACGQVAGTAAAAAALSHAERRRLRAEQGPGGLAAAHWQRWCLGRAWRAWLQAAAAAAPPPL